MRGSASGDLGSVRNPFTILTDAGNEIIVLDLSAERDFDATT